MTGESLYPRDLIERLRSERATEWRSTDENGYEVSAAGQVRGPSGKILKPNLNKGGYLRVAFRGRSRNIHILVCTAFHGAKPSELHEVAHGNGQKLDNRAENLRWATRAENYADQVRHGVAGLHMTGRPGQRHPQARLTDAQADEIRDRYRAGGISLDRLGALYGVCGSTVSKIARGQRYVASIYFPESDG